MQIGQNGVDLIKRWEGLELEAYQDVVGIWTIGYGHTDEAGPPEVTPGMVISEREAEDILRRDLGQYEDAVNRAVKVDITQDMFDALVSITFNIGPTAMRRSTFIKRLNTKDYEGCAEAMTWWNKAGGQVVRGLQNRRNDEAALFMRGYEDGNINAAEAGLPRGGNVTENTPRRSNLAQSRTMNGSAVAGSAGAVGAGAVLLDDDDDDQGQSEAEDNTTPPPADDPFPELTPEDLATMTPTELASAASSYGLSIQELREQVATGEATEVPAIVSVLEAQERQDAIIVAAGIMVVLATIYVMYARWDDWKRGKR
ncbi:MAG: glycoside hydrolase family protein [Pseudomonadota bacterium]